jgi:hypothetical protein
MNPLKSLALLSRCAGLFQAGLDGTKAQCPAACPGHRAEIPFQLMIGLKKFTNQQVQKYRQRVEEFSNTNAKYCHACQSYVPAKYQDRGGYLTCTCGERTCSRCLKGKPTCTCCVHCRLPRAECKCCVNCKRLRDRCTCTTMVTNSSRVTNEVQAAFPTAKKCPNCPQGWIKEAGCNHSIAHS